MKLFKRKSFWIDIVPMLGAGVLILYFAISRQQTLIKTLPTVITLVVQLLLIHANCYGFLLGGCNAVLYGFAGYTEGLYFSAISAAFISAPIQFFSFFNWKKQQNKKTTILRFLPLPALLLWIIVIFAGWAFCHFVISPFFAGVAYPALDALSFSIGIVSAVLASLGYVESQYINFFSCVISLFIWIMLTVANPANFNYIILSCYNLFCVIKTAIQWTIKYHQSKKESLT